MPYADIGAALAQSATAWEDLRWIREAWKGPIVIKGVHTADDARRAVDAGARAIVVSNHGGRQLDGVAPTLRVLPEVVAAVGGRVEVLLDGGIRRGGDVAKALALGARAVLVGRAYAYGLGAGGGAGVTKAIEILRADLERTLRLLGCPVGRRPRRLVRGRPAALAPRGLDKRQDEAEALRRGLAIAGSAAGPRGPRERTPPPPPSGARPRPRDAGRPGPGPGSGLRTGPAASGRDRAGSRRRRRCRSSSGRGPPTPG